MIPYETRDIITPIVNFIKTCPFVEEFSIDLSEMEIGQFMNMDKPSSMLEYTGSSIVSDESDINDNRIITRQGNFQLYLLKKSDNKVYQKNTTLFIDNFEQWIDYCQINDLIPKISNIPFKGEKMTAQNGMFFDRVPTEDGGFMELNQYMIQLTKTYQIFYEKEFEL